MFAIARNQNDCSSNLVKSQGFCCCCCLAVKGNKFQKNQFIGSLLYTCDMQEKRSVMWQSQQWTPTVWAWSHWISLTPAYTRCALEYGLHLPDQIICLELSMCWQKKKRRRRTIRLKIIFFFYFYSGIWDISQRSTPLYIEDSTLSLASWVPKRITGITARLRITGAMTSETTWGLVKMTTLLQNGYNHDQERLVSKLWNVLGKIK